MQPLGEATGEAPEEEEEDEEDESIGAIARKYLNIPREYREKLFGVRKIDGDHYIGNKHVIIKDDDIIIKENGDRFLGTPDLWRLIMLRDPPEKKNISR